MFSRIKDRKGDPDYTPLKEHAEILGKILKCPVKYVDDVFGDKAKAAIKNLKGGEILVLENVRSWDKETKSATPEEASKTELVQNLAPLADFFVNDAFAAAHRGHVSAWLASPLFCHLLLDASWNVN